MERLSKDMYYLKIASTVLLRSTCMRKRYGAVLVKANRIIATGYNGAPKGTANCIDLNYCERIRSHIKAGEHYELCRAIHAEDNAITFAGRECVGATLYLAGQDVETGNTINAMPCVMCIRKIINNGIEKVILLQEDNTILTIYSEEFPTS